MFYIHMHPNGWIKKWEWLNCKAQDPSDMSGSSPKCLDTLVVVVCWSSASPQVAPLARAGIHIFQATLPFFGHHLGLLWKIITEDPILSPKKGRQLHHPPACSTAPTQRHRNFRVDHHFMNIFEHHFMKYTGQLRPWVNKNPRYPATVPSIDSYSLWMYTSPHMLPSSKSTWTTQPVKIGVFVDEFPLETEWFSGSNC